MCVFPLENTKPWEWCSSVSACVFVCVCVCVFHSLSFEEHLCPGSTVLTAGKSSNQKRYGPCLHEVCTVVGKTNITYTNKCNISAIISAPNKRYVAL